MNDYQQNDNLSRQLVLNEVDSNFQQIDDFKQNIKFPKIVISRKRKNSNEKLQLNHKKESKPMENYKKRVHSYSGQINNIQKQEKFEINDKHEKNSEVYKLKKDIKFFTRQKSKDQKTDAEFINSQGLEMKKKQTMITSNIKPFTLQDENQNLRDLDNKQQQILSNLQQIIDENENIKLNDDSFQNCEYNDQDPNTFFNRKLQLSQLNDKIQNKQIDESLKLPKDLNKQLVFLRSKKPQQQQNLRELVHNQSEIMMKGNISKNDKTLNPSSKDQSFQEKLIEQNDDKFLQNLQEKQLQLEQIKDKSKVKDFKSLNKQIQNLQIPINNNYLKNESKKQSLMSNKNTSFNPWGDIKKIVKINEQKNTNVIQASKDSVDHKKNIQSTPQRTLNKINSVAEKIGIKNPSMSIKEELEKKKLQKLDRLKNNLNLKNEKLKENFSKQDIKPHEYISYPQEKQDNQSNNQDKFNINLEMQKMESLFLKNQGALKDLYSIKEGLNILDLHKR